MTCPSCHQPITSADLFCEACGADLATTADPAGAPSGAPTAEREAGSGGPATSVVARVADPEEPDVGAVACLACGGAVGPDWFCTSCGFKARTPRDHWTEAPAPWVGGVCDKGIAHARNEDAMAIAATPEAVTTATAADEAGSARAVLVVCDGVTSAPESDRASIAAARAACASLIGTPDDGGSVAGRVAAWQAALEAACADANTEAVAVARRLGDPPEPPSCTFVAAVATAGLACVAWCGDSRAYWIPDGGPGRQLGADHSVGQELIAAGVATSDAERDPQFHTITRWLGADSIDPTPEFASIPLDQPGYLLVCSDGLWNYANGAAPIAELLRAAAAAGAVGPVALSESLAAWANDRGGHDNITVAVARIDPAPGGPRVP